MAVDGGVDVVEHGHVLVELVADLHAELALARDAGPQRVQLRVLLVQDLLVVRVDLRVRHLPRRVPVPRPPVLRVVPVPAAPEQLRLQVGVAGSGRRGVVGEPHRLGGCAGALGPQVRRRGSGLGVGSGGRRGGVLEVAVEGRVVRMRERGRGRGRGEAVELRR